MSPEELKALLATPAALFAVMLLGSLANGLKQLNDARRNGGSSSLISYLSHWPETLATLVTNALGFATLVVTDQLNFASAIGIGYAANSAADLLRSGGRSGMLAGATRQGGFARIGMLLAVAIAAIVLMTGCATNPETGKQEITEGGKAALKEVAVIGVRRYAREHAGSENIERIRRALAELQVVEDITTVDGLRAQLQLRIDTKVSDPYDREDLTSLLNIVAPLLKEHVGAGDLAPGQLVQLRDFIVYLARALPPA